jgi:glucose/arabinose dehydrogenase
VAATKGKMDSNNTEAVGPVLVDSNYKVEKVVSGIDNPVGIAFVDKDDFLIIEKNSGMVKRFTNGTLLNQSLVDINVANANDRGLLGIAISNDNPENKTFVFLYLMESRITDGEGVCDEFFICDAQRGPLGNRLYKYELNNNSLVNPKILFDIPPFIYALHGGGKVIVGKDNNLYLGVGDLNLNTLLTSNVVNGTVPYGTGGIIRLTQNGSEVTPGIFGDEYPYNLYYAYGVRNTYGMAFDPLTGNLWDTENGPGFGDEINLVKPGFNSGWKKVMGIREVTSYTGGNITLNPNGLITLNGVGEYSPPELATDKFTLGITDLVFLNSTIYGSDYENDMFVSDYNANGTLYHFDLVDNRTKLLLNKSTGIEYNTVLNLSDLEPYVFGKDFGGIADLEISPDGYLYIVSIQFGTIFKLVPI